VAPADTSARRPTPGSTGTEAACFADAGAAEAALSTDPDRIWGNPQIDNPETETVWKSAPELFFSQKWTGDEIFEKGIFDSEFYHENKHLHG
jgi:hypothetical protein